MLTLCARVQLSGVSIVLCTGPSCVRMLVLSVNELCVCALSCVNSLHTVFMSMNNTY